MSQRIKLFSALSKAEMSDISQAKSAMSARFLGGRTGVRGVARALRAEATAANTHNVVGVGIDEKYVDGVPTGIEVVKFLVRSKLPLSSLSNKEKLPQTVDGIPTDVEEVGLIVPFARKTAAKAKAAKAAKATKAAAKGSAPSATSMPNPQTRMRPAQPGCSVGFREPNDAFIMAGTFGALVRDSQGRTYILSNNHVLAFENGVEADGITRRERSRRGPRFSNRACWMAGTPQPTRSPG